MRTSETSGDSGSTRTRPSDAAPIAAARKSPGASELRGIHCGFFNDVAASGRLLVLLVLLVERGVDVARQRAGLILGDPERLHQLPVEVALLVALVHVAERHRDG